MDPPPDAEIVEIRVGLLWLGPEGLIRDVIKAGAQIDVADCDEVVEAWKKVSGGTPTPIVLDITGVGSATKGARDYFRRPEVVEWIPALALVVNSTVGRAVGNFFMRLTNPEFPTRMFTSEEDAVSWARGFLPPR